MERAAGKVQGAREVKESGLPLAMVGPQFASRAVSVLGYKAQLVPPPRNFTTAELWAAHKVMGMPLSLDVESMFNMDKYGGVKLVRVVNYLHSCMLRAVTKTL